jgi:hypothetical protein
LFYSVQEGINRTLLEINETLEAIEHSLSYKDFNREVVKQYPSPYNLISVIPKNLADLQDSQRSIYNEKFEKTIHRIDSVFHQDMGVYTQLVCFEIMITFGRFKSDVWDHSFIEDFGEYPDGGFMDYSLGLLEYIVEVMSGIDLVGHSSYYPWLNALKEEIGKLDDDVRRIVEKATTHWAKKDAIFLPDDYLTWFIEPHWWRVLELKVYNEVKKGQR